MKLLAFGEVLWDLYPDEKFIGGASLNFAAHFVKCGGEAYILTALGKDGLGNDALSVLEEMRLNTSLLTFNSLPTGRCIVSLNENMIPSYDLLDNVAYDLIDAPSSADGFDLLYLGTLALRHEHNRQSVSRIISQNSFREIFVDVNVREPYCLPEALLLAMSSATILKISDEELGSVISYLSLKGNGYRDAALTISKRFPSIRLIIVTRGEKGAYLYDAVTGSELECKGIAVKVASTVGAGDSFGAAFAACYLDGKGLEECLRCATAVSAFVVSNTASVPDYSLDMLIRD